MPITSSSSILKLAAAAILALTAFTSAIALPVRHFNVEGTFRATGLGEGNAATRSNIVNALDGKAFSVSFDLNFATPDSDPDASQGLFLGSVSNTAATSGSFGFAPIVNSCVSPDLDCYLEVANDQFGFGIDTYFLRTGFVQSDALNTLVSSTLPGVGNIVGGVPVGTTVTTSFSFGESRVGLFSAANMSGPTDLNIAGTDIFSFFSRSDAFFITTFGLGSVPEAGRVSFDLDITRISEGFGNPGPVTAVPEPDIYLMILAGLALVVAFTRPRKKPLVP
jgi:hypothetical protein